LPNESSGLDRLPEAYFVREQVPLNGVGRDSSNDLELMQMELDRTKQETCNPGRCGTLRTPRSEHVQTTLVDERGVAAHSLKYIERVGNACVPADVKGINRQYCTFGVWEGNEIAVRMLRVLSVDPTNPPPAAVM
jgi:hypothetical protein